MEPRRLRLAQQEPGRGQRREHGTLRGDLGVAEADRFQERVAGLDGGLFAVGTAPRPGDLGRVGVRPQTERVELADPDLGRVVDLTDRGRHDRRRILRATLGQGQRRERRIDRLDELDVLGPRGERGERQEVVGGLLEATAGEGQAPDQLLGQDLVDPQSDRPPRRAGPPARSRPSVPAGRGRRPARRACACRRSASGRAARPWRWRHRPARSPPRAAPRHRSPRRCWRRPARCRRRCRAPGRWPARRGDRRAPRRPRRRCSG